MTYTKSFWQSKTIFGALLVLMGQILGYAIEPSEAAQILMHLEGATSNIQDIIAEPSNIQVILMNLDAILSTVGAIIAIFGRVTAKRRIG